MSKDSDAVRNWWRTSIIDMEPGRIAFRGHPIEDLVGNVSKRVGEVWVARLEGEKPLCTSTHRRVGRKRKDSNLQSHFSTCTCEWGVSPDC